MLNASMCVGSITVDRSRVVRGGSSSYGCWTPLYFRSTPLWQFDRFLVILLKDLLELRRIWRTWRKVSQFFKELFIASRRQHAQDPTWLVSDILERMGHITRHKHKRSGSRRHRLRAQVKEELPFQDVKRLFVLVMHMRGGTRPGPELPFQHRNGSPSVLSPSLDGPGVPQDMDDLPASRRKDDPVYRCVLFFLHGSLPLRAGNFPHSFSRRLCTFQRPISKSKSARPSCSSPFSAVIVFLLSMTGIDRNASAPSCLCVALTCSTITQ